MLFYLNMLRLFQEINQTNKCEIKLVFDKNVSFKYLIQGFNPHLLNGLMPNYLQIFNELKNRGD
jgi:hypothetical protein